MNDKRHCDRIILVFVVFFLFFFNFFSHHPSRSITHNRQEEYKGPKREKKKNWREYWETKKK